LINFVAEFLVLLGTYPRSVPLAAVGAAGMVLAAVYSLWIVQRAFHGPRAAAAPRLPDLDARETVVLGAMALLIVALGLWPQPLLEATRPVLALLGLGGRL
jgi:NADH-quinone oxidoreductase subunit M